MNFYQKTDFIQSSTTANLRKVKFNIHYKAKDRYFYKCNNKRSLIISFNFYLTNLHKIKNYFL